MTNTPFHWRRNLYALYVIKLSKWLMLVMPIVALFYNENGLSSLNIYLLQAVYSAALALMEIPSGYMADIWGRKRTLLLGAVLGAAGFAIYSLSHSLSGFFAAELVLGLGGSFISGSDTAILYDTLDAVKMREQYLRYEGRITALGNFAETGAALCGGLLAWWLSYRSVYVAQTLIAATAIPAAILLREPPVPRTRWRTPGFGHILQICRHSLVENKPLSAAICQSAITGIATLCMAWSTQIYFVNRGFSEISITPLWVALNLIVGLVSAWTARIDRMLSPKHGLALIVIGIPLGYILLGSLPTLPALVALFLFYALRGYATPVLKNYTNLHCDSSIRATVFSIRSLIIRLGFALLGPAIGAVAEKTSFDTALTTAGGLLLVASLISGMVARRRLHLS